MKHVNFILFYFLSFFVGTNAYASSQLNSLLKELDQTLTDVSVYDSQKEQRLDQLKSKLAASTSSEETHRLYTHLYKEYEAYVFDSAMYYVKEHLDISLKEKNTYWVNECKMYLSRMYSTFARFPEAIELLKSIDRTELTAEQMGSYYFSFAEIYIYWGEYTSSDERFKYVALKDTYQDSTLMYLPKDTYEYDLNSARKCMEMKDFGKAESHLRPHLESLNVNTREYAIVTSLMAYLYNLKGDRDTEMDYLAMSAIADIKASIKENTSIRSLAFFLLNPPYEEIKRSNRYIKKSLEDANFYNGRLRNVQIAAILPVIDKAYQMERESYQERLQMLVAVVGILSLFLIALVVHLFGQMKKLSRARKEVTEANSELTVLNKHLSETNRIKEEYIGRFLNQCSLYIDKLEAYRKSLNKKAATGKVDELYTMLKSSKVVDDELKDFYQNFDNTFLNIFPHFVSEFNKLLPEEDRITPKNNTGLTVELRIFALIRLGITDSAKIANFLRYSITTIYNYRSKYRNKSLISRDMFEETIMKIGGE